MEPLSRTITPKRFGFGRVAACATGVGGASVRVGLNRLRAAMIPYDCAAGAASGGGGTGAAAVAGGRARAGSGPGHGVRAVRIISATKRAQAMRSARLTARNFLGIDLGAPGQDEPGQGDGGEQLLGLADVHDAQLQILHAEELGRRFQAGEQIHELPDLPRHRDVDGDLEDVSAIDGRQDALAPDFRARLSRHVLHELLQLRGGYGRRGGREEAPGHRVDLAVDSAELRGDGILPPQECLAPREHVLARRDDFLGGPIALEGRLDREEPGADDRRSYASPQDEAALSSREVGHQRPSPPRTGALASAGARGGARRPEARGAGVPGGGAAGVAERLLGVSQAALIRNCSLSRPLVTGEENSTRSNRGEFSRRGMRELAADACPLSSIPLLSKDKFVTHASGGTSSVSSRRTGSGFSALASSDSIAVRSFRLRSSSRWIPSTARTCGVSASMRSLVAARYRFARCPG